MRHLLMCPYVLCAWVLLGPGVDAAHADSHSGPHIFTPARFDLMVYSIIVFLVLLFILKKFAWKPMLEGLQKREANIRSALAEAQRAREEAKRLSEELQHKINNAHETAREILEEARRDAQHTTEEMIARARGEIQIERDRLRREIETARDQALQELWNQTAQVASLVSSKAIRRYLSAEDHRRLIDESLVELREAGKARERQTAGVLA